MKWTGRATWLLLSLPAILLVVACTQASPTVTSEPQPTATVTSPPLQSAVAATATIPPSPEPEASATDSLPEATAGPAANEDEPGPFPEPLARVSLAPVEAQLDDLLLDSNAGRLYVTDTSGQLHILDAATYQEIAKLGAAGELTLDPDRNRLYVSPEHADSELIVVDTEGLTVMGTISPGGRVALDSRRDRLYIGNPASFVIEEDARGVRVYDAETLIKIDTVAQPGIPVYNELRDELHIVDYTAHIVDPDTLTVTGDLIPEITEQPLARCNGCLAATDAHFFPDRELLVVEVTILSAGKGPGTEPPPRFFDAATLDEITDLSETPPVERGCQHRLILAEPVDGRVYRGEHYNRYISYNNLLVSDLAGSLLTWRDGLGLGVTNPSTGQMYILHGEDMRVLDLAALAPAGTLPLSCIHTLDVEQGRIYAFVEGDLIVLYTDGVTESTNLQNEEFGEQRLIQFISEQHTLPATDLITRIKDAAMSFAGEAPQFDDFTLMLVKIT